MAFLSRNVVEGAERLRSVLYANIAPSFFTLVNLTGLFPSSARSPKRNDHKENEASVAVPAGTIVGAASQGAINPASIPNPSLEGSRSVNVDWLARNVAEGEQIFVLQYRQINLKKHFFFSKPSSADYGRIKVSTREMESMVEVLKAKKSCTQMMILMTVVKKEMKKTKTAKFN
ncbi:hypothetical protein B0O99DRAFT_681232 [Bisporella sp. PMI_857]|nr:hypothetical protein B0O99DRAFT_681232 [Bisporella sp. PMI_857]